MSEITENEKQAAGGAGAFLFRLLGGCVIGIGAVLPGISGGVLATIFGIYKPLISVFAHPKTIKKYWKVLLPAAIGIAIGFLGLAKLVQMLFQANENIAVAFFVGLIAGTLPSLWRTAGEQGAEGEKAHPAPDLVRMAIAFAVILAALMFFRFGTGVTVVPSAPWFALCGFLMALCMIVPGVAAPTIMLFLGLYEPLMGLITGVVSHALRFVTGKESFAEAFAASNWLSVVLFALAFIVTLPLLSKPVDLLIRKKPVTFYHIIVGIVAATVIPLLPYDAKSAGELAVRIACIALGFAVSFVLDIVTRKFGKKDQ
ncbi:MAG: DUF368 domain-containing protein [Clostridia bacterium]|nr:DUF368 domain-containing protein [Clostridia bacterium]